MLHIKFNSGLLLMILFFSFISCRNDNNPVTIQNQIQNNVQSGTWKITKYIDSGTDETFYFTGYNFTFGNNGVLTANNGTTNYTGNWAVADSNSNDDSISDLDFVINFPAGGYLESLNDDWDLISQSSIKIELIDVSGGNGDIDYLTFEKN